MVSKLFAHLNFLIIDDDNENKGNIQNVNDTLKDAGCENIYTYITTSTEILDLNDSKQMFIKEYDTKDLHFIVSNNINFPFYRVAAFDYLIPVVTTFWVKECVERNHLLRTLNFSPDPRHILKDTTIYIARNLTMSNADYRFYTEIVTSLGGMCVESLTNKITHLVATSNSNPVVINFCQAVKNLDNIKIVYPTWLIHCFKTQQYIKESTHQIEVNITSNGSSQSNINSDERIEDLWDEVESKSIHPSTLQYLQGHKFIVDLELSLSSQLYSFLIQLIKHYGGSFLPYIDINDIETNKQIDCFIGGSINTKGYETCEKKGLHTGNIIWFFNIWSFQSFLPPQKKIIWSPFKHKIFKSKDLLLSHTNYFGQERIYIQKLTELLGGSTTTSLSSSNTHLLAKFPYGKKFVNAVTKKPNCKVVNHLWLEKCYDQGKVLDATLKDFKDYDIGKKSLSSFLNQIGKVDLTVEENKLTSSKLVNSQSILNDSISSDEDTDLGFSTANENDTTIPDVNKSAPVGNSSVLVSTPTLMAKKQPSIELSSDFVSSIEPAATSEENSTEPHVNKNKSIGQPAKSEKDDEDEYNNLFGVLTETVDNPDSFNKENKETPNTPAASRQTSSAKVNKVSLEEPTIEENTNEATSATKEPLTPPVDNIVSSFVDPILPRRRAARAKAEKRLHEDIESLNEFEKNRKKKRIGNLLPTEIKKLEHIKEVKKQAKDTILGLKNLPSGENDDEILKQLKHSYNIKAFVTGCHDELCESNIEKLSLFGVQIVNEYQKMLNCIIAPKKLRTVKFLNALSFHPLEYVISPDFITHLIKNIDSGENPVNNVNVELYKIKDISDEVLEKTKMNNKLFDRAYISNINIASDVPGSLDTISSILMNHGIKEVQRLSKKPFLTNNHPHKKILLQNGKMIHPPKCVIISGNNPTLRKWKKTWNEQNDGSGDGLLIVSWDWCVGNIFQLDVDYNEKENVLFNSL